MANIPRAPFFIPRPAEDQLWSKGPISNRGLVDAVSTELKWYGAPGQVPTKHWYPLYDYSSGESFWNQTSQSPNQSLQKSALSSNIPGGVFYYPKADDPSAWQFVFDYNRPLNTTTVNPVVNNYQRRWLDDFSVWSGQSTFNLLPSALANALNLLNTTSMMTPADDAAIWQPSRQRSIALPFVPNIKANFWRYNNDDSAIWVQPPQRSIGLPFVPNIEANFWDYNNDDPSAWQFVFDYNQPLNTTTVSPVTSRQKRFNIDDSSSDIWQGTPLISNTLAELDFTPRSPFFAPRPSEEQLWARISIAPSIGLPLVPIINNFIPTRMHLRIDDWATWQFVFDYNQPLYIAPVSPIISRQSSFFDDSLPWQQPLQRSIALPFVPNIEANFWRYNIDDPTYWQPPVQRSIGLPLVPPIRDRWPLATVDDSSIWLGSSTFSKTLEQVEFAPTVLRQWLFGYDDPSFWVGNPISSASIPMLTIGGIIKPLQWLFGSDDPSVWQFAFEYNQSIIASTSPSTNIPGGTFYYSKPEDPAVWAGWENRNLANITVFAPLNPFIPVFYRFNADDSAIWVQPPQRFIGLPFVPNIKANFWSYNNNDAAVSWQQPVQRSIVLPLLPPIQNRYRLDLSDDQLWALTVQRDLSLLNTTVATPITSRQAQFSYDDAAVWHARSLLSSTLAKVDFVPTVPRQWLFGSDDPAFWVNKPNSSASIPMLTAGGIIKAKQWNANHDDHAVWSRVWVNRDLINTVTVSNPFIQNPYLSRTNMVIDGLPVWKSPYNQNLYFVAPVTGASLPLVKFIGNVGHMMIRQ